MHGKKYNLKVLRSFFFLSDRFEMHIFTGHNTNQHNKKKHVLFLWFVFSIKKLKS